MLHERRGASQRPHQATTVQSPQGMGSWAPKDRKKRRKKKPRSCARPFSSSRSLSVSPSPKPRRTTLTSPPQARTHHPAPLKSPPHSCPLYPPAAARTTGDAGTMLCLSLCAPHLHLHLPRSPTARPAAATCRNARCIGVTLCLRMPTTPEERRQKRGLAQFLDLSAAPTLTPPAPTPVHLTPAAKRRGALREMRRVWWVCGVGYWVQGFRCFPWLALNFHLTRGMGLSPAGLQLLQNAGSLPLVAKPLFGVLSDAVYIGRAHRIPYISLGGTQPIPFLLPFPRLFLVLFSYYVRATPVMLELEEREL